MSTAAWLDDLAELTGEQLYHLLGALTEAREATAVAMALYGADDKQKAGWLAVYTETCELFSDTASQLARFTCPIREASAIVWRARYARRHPVVIASG